MCITAHGQLHGDVYQASQTTQQKSHLESFLPGTGCSPFVRKQRFHFQFSGSKVRCFPDSALPQPQTRAQQQVTTSAPNTTQICLYFPVFTAIQVQTRISGNSFPTTLSASRPLSQSIGHPTARTRLLKICIRSCHPFALELSACFTLHSTETNGMLLQTFGDYTCPSLACTSKLLTAMLALALWQPSSVTKNIQPSPQSRSLGQQLPLPRRLFSKTLSFLPLDLTLSIISSCSPEIQFKLPASPDCPTVSFTAPTTVHKHLSYLFTCLLLPFPSPNIHPTCLHSHCRDHRLKCFVLFVFTCLVNFRFNF